MIHFTLSPTQIRLLLLTGFFTGVVGIFGTFLTNFGLGESGYNFLGKTKKVTLAPGMPVLQTFTAKENNLSQIRFDLRNVNLASGDHIDLTLMDGTCTQILTTTAFTKKPHTQGAYTVFSFPPIPTSRDTRYCFSATYFSDTNRKGEKPYLAATDIPDPVFADRTLTDSNKGKTYAGQTLFLRPAYTSGSLSEDLKGLEYRLSQYKPAFFKGIMLPLAFLLVLLSTILAYSLSDSILRKDKDSSV